MSNTDYVGHNIAKYRKEKGLLGKDLATIANITPPMLSQIERGQVNPSLPTLQAIADALDVPVYVLFFPEEQEDEYVFRGRGHLDDLDNLANTHVVRVTPGHNFLTEVLLMLMPPHSVSNKELRGHKGEEISYVVSGNITVYRPTDTVNLMAGDAIKIRAQLPHYWENNSDEPAVVLMAISTI